MSIRAGAAPPAVTGLVGRAMQSLSGRNLEESAFALKGAFSPQLHPPLPIYHLAMARLTPASRASDARRIGWRFFVSEGDALRTVDVHGRGASAQVTAITSGGSVDHLAAATQFAERAVGDSGTFEARVLEFGRAGCGALWLHSRAASDRFFSLEGTPTERTEQDVIAEAVANAATYRRSDAGGGIGTGPRDVGG